MRRDQLEHAIRTACQIIGHGEVIVVGSQSVLGTFDENQLPAAATMSQEVDILPIADSAAEVQRLADDIEGVAGEFSLFEQQHGFRIDGVDLGTCALPEGWRKRAVFVFRTRIPLRRRGIRSSRACVWNQRTFVWRSCARSVRRIKTLSRRC